MTTVATRHRKNMCPDKGHGLVRAFTVAQTNKIAKLAAANVARAAMLMKNPMREARTNLPIW